jgi:hypothetical protein
MQRVLVAVVALAIGGAGPSSAAALSPIVSSHQIAPRERPVISFTAERRVAGNLWYEVHLRAIRRRDGCEFYEEIAITYAFPGQWVTVRPKPWDTGRWCPGRWRGRIYLVHRESCDEPSDDDSGVCFGYSESVGRFWFRVVP